MNSDLFQRLLPSQPTVVAMVGLMPEEMEEVAQRASRLPGPPTLVDLDAISADSPLPSPTPGSMLIIARTFTDLRRVVSLAVLLPAAKHLIVAVADWAPQPAVALPRVWPDLPSVREVASRRGTDGEWVIEVRFTKSTATGQFLAAVARGIDGNPPQQILRVAVAGPGVAHWRPGDPSTVPTTEAGPLEGPNGFLPADLVLRTVGANPAAWTDPRVKVVNRPTAEAVTWANLGRPGAIDEVIALVPTLSNMDFIPPVDERTVNPIGFLTNPTLGTATLTQIGDRWAIQGGGAESVPIHPSGAVADADVAKLRQLRAVSIDWGRHTGPVAAMRTVAALSVAGVPLHATSVPGWASGLGAALIELITSVKPGDLDDDLSREEHSIRLRRAALRAHSTQARLRSLARVTHHPLPAPARVSVILCTRRLDYVGSALAQIARQRYVDLEVILVLHGLPADLPEVRAATASFPWPCTVVEVGGDVVFGAALNRGAAAASGQILAKWDDDDWYGPEFLADAVLAAGYSGADLVGCLHQLIYLEQIDLTVRRPGGDSERFSRHISGNSLMMTRHVFDAAGGFPPISRNVDTGLLRVIEAEGGRIYRTHGMASMVHRHESGHTWNPPLTGFLRVSTRQWRGFQPGVLMEFDEIKESVCSPVKPRGSET